MHPGLQHTLSELTKANEPSNQAVNTLVGDYTKYHTVFVVGGGLVLLMLTVMSVFFWMRFRRAPRSENKKWTFEKKTYLSFAMLATVIGLMLSLIVFANATNVLNPQHGFSLLVDSLGSPKVGTPAYDRYESFNTWVISGSDRIPQAIQRAIDERLSWQAPKAIICAILLAVVTVLGIRIWADLVRRSRKPSAGSILRKRALLASGVATVALSLLLVVMVLANAQGALAPMTLTLLYG